MVDVMQFSQPKNLLQNENDHCEGGSPSQSDHCQPKNSKCFDEVAVISSGDEVYSNEGFQDSAQSSEAEEDLDDTNLEKNGWIPNVTTVHQQTQEIGTENGIILPSLDLPEYGDVCIKNSSNVHLGNKVFYKGQVSIKQIVYTNPLSFNTVDDINSVKVDSNKETYTNLKTTEANTAPQNNQHTENQFAHENYKKVKQWLWTWKFAAAFCLTALFIMAVTVASIVIATRNSNFSPQLDFPDDSDEINKLSVIKDVKFVPRVLWGAQPPSENITRLVHPVPYVIISHTATDFCYTQAKCTLVVRIAQTYHMSSYLWSDIAYNFLIGGDGLVYVGRSWDFVGSHTFNYNKVSIGISFIGTFTQQKPSTRQIDAAHKLISYGVKLGKISPNYKLLGHCQLSPTESPGAILYSLMKKWPHWSPDP